MQERSDLFGALNTLLTPGGRLLLVSGIRGDNNDPGTANLNLATSSMRGCTPLPELREMTDQLSAAGYEQMQVTRLMPGSAVYGIEAGKALQ